MGIERFEDGDDPTPPADADPSKDADRSAEVASSSDVRRAEDQTPDSPPRESPEGVAAKQAEPRTRDEYADHLAPSNSSPIEEAPPKPETEELSHSEDDFRVAVSPGHGHAEELHLAEEPDEQRGVEEQAHSNSPAALGGKQGCLSARAEEAAQPYNERPSRPTSTKSTSRRRNQSGLERARSQTMRWDVSVTTGPNHPPSTTWRAFRRMPRQPKRLPTARTLRQA